MIPEDKIFEEIKIRLDDIIDKYNMGGTVQHIDAVTAIDNLHRECNRASFIEKENHENGTM